MQAGIQFWVKVAMFNLLLVALLGLLMRYKIGFEFPYLDQKHLQFSHYHFAFYGWISHTLMVLMVYSVHRKNRGIDVKKYNTVFLLNLAGSYGMLVSFIFRGYGIGAVAFSAIAITALVVFAVLFIKDLSHSNTSTIVSTWFKAALLFNIISSIGVFAIAYMMLTKNLHQTEYLASVYYFLHFQYNGWFFFACMGLFMNYIGASCKTHTTAFRLFFVSCIPAYFLSTLWLHIPTWLYIIVAIAAFVQLYAWVLILKQLISSQIIKNSSQPIILQYILLFIGIAVSIKLLLQLGSIVPAISKLAFGFRPVVIAYLHLVLLAIISFFLLFYIYAGGILSTSRKILIGLAIFSAGVFINEIVLAIQGIAAFSYTVLPYANEMLFAAAIFLVAGIAVLFTYSVKKGI